MSLRAIVWRLASVAAGMGSLFLMVFEGLTIPAAVLAFSLALCNYAFYLESKRAALSDQEDGKK